MGLTPIQVIPSTHPSLRSGLARGKLAIPSDNADPQLARAMLLAAFARDAAPADLFTVAERRVSAKLVSVEGNAARWHGYLALLAYAQGDRERFRRAHATYRDLPRRPDSLDALLAEVASREDK